MCRQYISQEEIEKYNFPVYIITNGYNTVEEAESAREINLKKIRSTNKGRSWHIYQAYGSHGVIKIKDDTDTQNKIESDVDELLKSLMDN